VNLHVDLILEGEQRSASPLSAKSLTRVATVTGPLILVVLGGLFLLNWLRVQRDSRVLRMEIAAIEPKVAEARKLKEMLATHRETHAELEGWKRSRLEWHARMHALRGIVPRSIQLTSLRVSQAISLVEAKAPAKSYSLTMEGLALGPSAEDDIKRFRARLLDRDKGVDLAKVEVARYQAYTGTGATEYDRVFTFECSFTPRKIE
jgi:Tfp pilus assembly protein PilN